MYKWPQNLKKWRVVFTAHMRVVFLLSYFCTSLRLGQLYTWVLVCTLQFYFMSFEAKRTHARCQGSTPGLNPTKFFFLVGITSTELILLLADRCCVVQLLMAGRHFVKLICAPVWMCHANCQPFVSVRFLCMPPSGASAYFQVKQNYTLLFLYFYFSFQLSASASTHLSSSPPLHGGGLVSTSAVSLLCFPSICLLWLSTTLTETLTTDLRFLTAPWWILPVGFVSLLFFFIAAHLCQSALSLSPSLPSFVSLLSSL